MPRSIEAKRRARNKWYRKNKERQLRNQKIRRKELIEWFVNFKRGLSCSVCGMKFFDRPECCDLHHVNPAEKTNTVGLMLAMGKKKLLAEIKKCIPLCANCHRTIHKIKSPCGSTGTAAHL